MRGKHILTLTASLCLASAAVTAYAAQQQSAFTPENSGFHIMPIAPADDNGAALDPTVLPNNPGNVEAAQKQREFTPVNPGSNIMPIAPADHNGALLGPTMLPNNLGNAAAAQKQREFTPANSGFSIMPIARAGDHGAALDSSALPNNPGNAAVVPEPTTWGMLILGSALLAGIQRFRRKHL